MEIFFTTLNRMAFLFLFMAAGFLLGKMKIMPAGSENILSKLENYLFMPALVMNTFITSFTVESLATSWKLLLFCEKSHQLNYERATETVVERF